MELSGAHKDERKELVEGGPSSSRRSRSLFCFVAVGVAVVLAIGLIILLALLEKSDGSGNAEVAAMSGSAKRPVGLEESINGMLYSEGFNGTWISDNTFIYRTDNNELALYDAATDKQRIILPKALYRKFQPFRYWLSADQKYLLLADNIRKLFRHSFLANYKIYDIETSQTWNLNPATGSDSSSSALLQLVKWAPKGNSLVYVYIGNIFYRKDPTSTNPNDDIMLTTTGKALTIFNGVPDWVYEEEILSSQSALWFSPDGSQLAYASFDDSQVEIMQLPIYGEPGDPRFQYPLMENIHYPKPGTPNPKVSLWIVDLSQSPITPKTWNPPSVLLNVEQHFLEVVWANSKELAVVWTNRVQNISIVQVCDARQGQCNDVFKMSEPHGWVDSPELRFSSDGKQFLLIHPHSQGDKGMFKHLTRVTRETGQILPLTSGAFTVTSILNWDEKSHEVLYLGTNESSPGQQHLYQVADGSSGTRSEPVCITCKLNTTTGEPCGYNNIKLSTSGSFYVLMCDGPGIPEVYLFDKNHRIKQVVTTNKLLHAIISDRAMPTKMNIQVPIKDDFTAEVTLRLPPGLDPTGDKKYPLFISVYAGPDTQSVTDAWKVDWGTYLSSAKDVIYGFIDGRGSGRKGDRMMFELYRRLGTVEVDDQIAVTKHLQKTLPFVDANRTAMWGWSYGGFVTAMTMATDTENVFSCGISVAPVTSWMYYDTIYTERYMGLPIPQDNFVGYNHSDVTWQVGNFRKKKYLLVHGTGDDNVHYQQSMILAKALEQEDILFRQLSYPDENHGIPRLKKHLYHSLTSFIDDCFRAS